MLDRAPLVQFTLGLDVCGVRLLCGVKRPKMNDLSICGLYVSAKPIPKSVRTEQPGRLIRCPRAALVLTVHGTRNVPEVAYSVVSLDAVDVVNVHGWEDAMHVKPCDSVGQVQDSINADESVAEVLGYAPRLTPIGNPIARRRYPRKNARLGIVVQQFAQSLRGKIGLSHDAVLSLIGQRLAGAINAARASLFSRMHHACAMGAA